MKFTKKTFYTLFLVVAALCLVVNVLSIDFYSFGDFSLNARAYLGVVLCSVALILIFRRLGRR